MPNTILNAKEFARTLAQNLELSQDTAEAVLKEFQDIVVAQLRNGGEVRLPGFGTFKTIKREAREARNPRTGEKLAIPSHSVARFVTGKNLKSLGDSS